MGSDESKNQNPQKHHPSSLKLRREQSTTASSPGPAVPSSFHIFCAVIDLTSVVEEENGLLLKWWKSSVGFLL